MVSGAIPRTSLRAGKAPSDAFYMLPVLEHLCEWGPSGGTLVPVLLHPGSPTTPPIPLPGIYGRALSLPMHSIQFRSGPLEHSIGHR